jgi:hypothetical protein
MQKLIILSIVLFTTITLMTACGENGNGSTTEATTEVSTDEVTNVSDSTLTTTEVVSETTKK